jgi:hypothetical protein
VISFNGRVGAIALALADVTGVLGFSPQPAGSYAAAIHTHTIANVTGLQAALDAKQAAGSYALSSDLTWTNIAGRPSTFAPSAHTHPISDVTGLQAALDGKQVAGSYAASVHGHAIADVTGLQTALDGKQAAGSYVNASAISAFGLTLVDDADAATARATLGLGSAATQASSAFQAAGSYVASSAFSAFGLSLVDDADATTARATLGLGSAATQPSSAFQPAGSYLSGNQTITLSGDISGSGTTGIATAIGPNKVTRGMLTTAASAAILGATAAGNVSDLTAAQAKSFLAIAATDVSGLGAFATVTDASNLTGTINAARLPVVVSGGAQGAMIGTDKAKLDAIASGATANSSDATLLSRANHTGTQPASTITGNTGGWTETTLASDFSNSTVTFNTITGFTFTPTANTNFEVQAAIMLQTATATVLPELQVSIGAGQAYGCVQIDQTGATVTTRVVQDGTFTTGAVNIAVPAGGFAAANTPYLAYVTIRGRSGASPGAISIQLASETAGTAVLAKTGSQMRYKLT